MIFIIAILISIVIITATIFFIVPKRPVDLDNYSLSEAENTNSYERADERYEVLKKADIEGTYLKNQKGFTNDEQSEKRL